VGVVADGRLTFLTPANDAGLVDVVVRNLDDDGVPIVGEEAVRSGAFTYAQPRLTAESDLTRLVRTLLRELKRQVLDNVVLTVQTDFDAETGDELHLAQFAALPGLVLVGPELVEDRCYSLNRLPEAPDVTVEVEGNVVVTAKGDASVDVDGDVTVSVGGSAKVDAGTEAVVSAPDVQLGASGLRAPVNGLVLGGGIDTFTGLTYAALQSASAVVKAKK
jgi:hypothetical protein